MCVLVSLFRTLQSFLRCREAQVTGLPATAVVPYRLGTVSLLQAGLLAGFAQKFISFPLDLLSVRIALGVNTSALGGSSYEVSRGIADNISN